jgi:hypothetical protein
MPLRREVSWAMETLMDILGAIVSALSGGFITL